MAIEKLYTVNESAEALRVSTWTIWKWIQTDRLRSAKVGDRRLVRESELRKMIVDDTAKVAK